MHADQFLRLDGRVAVVTGGARGIGLATARRLLRAGAIVAIWDLDDPAAAAELEELGAVDVQAVDVTRPDSVAEGLRELLDRRDRVDILINNAGTTGRTAELTSLQDSDWDEVLHGNLTSVFYCCRAVLPLMRARGAGAIVNIASVAGREGNPRQVPYSVSKAGVIALTRALAREVAPEIRVNCVAPALTRTRMIEGLPAEIFEYALKRIPMGRVAMPDEVAAVVHFLCSDDASFVTGQCYDVSGGRNSQ
ncbi:MAG: SDR family oxidoreductase [Solirubrobacterales bacterium]|nr:SDR family oxidoreductase [Solirubrobacterales bacterium]